MAVQFKKNTQVGKFGSSSGGIAARFRYVTPYQRLFVYGGSTLLFAILAVSLMIVYGSPVEADKGVVTSAPESPFGSIAVIAPVGRIPKGARINREQLQKIEWPRERVPEGALREIEDVEGMYSNEALSHGQPIIRRNLSANAPSFGIGEMLPPGHRAVTIKVDAISGIEGWARAGAHVDILLTYTDPKESVLRTRVVVEDAIVLSYGGDANKQLERDDKGVAEEIANTVTLAVTLDDSLKIQTAGASGTISLALRNSTDIDRAGERSFGANDWEKPEAPKAKKDIAKGFFRYTDPTGREKQFVLDQQDRWFANEQDPG